MALPSLPTFMSTLGIVLVYVFLSVGGLTLIKSASGLLTVQYLLGGVLYVAGFGIWIGVIIRIFPLSMGFPVSAGALIVGTQISGYLFLNETLSTLHLGGAFLIICGIYLIFVAGNTV